MDLQWSILFIICINDISNMNEDYVSLFIDNTCANIGHQYGNNYMLTFPKINIIFLHI